MCVCMLGLYMLTGVFLFLSWLHMNEEIAIVHEKVTAAAIGVAMKAQGRH